MTLPIFPLLFLMTSIGSILWYQRTENDIFGVLAVASALACVIWGLVISHWLIHLLSLIVLLTLRTPIFSAIQVKVKSQYLQTHKINKIKLRGAAAQLNVPSEIPLLQKAIATEGGFRSILVEFYFTKYYVLQYLEAYTVCNSVSVGVHPLLTLTLRRLRRLRHLQD